MKIKVDREKLIRAVRKIEGIEVVLENEQDAKEALDLILRKTAFFESEGKSKLKELNVKSLQEYNDSAVSYRVMFLLDFIFEDDVATETKITLIKQLQEFFGKL